MSATLYDILGISPSASAEELKTAYKKLAKLYHPDKNQGSSWHEEQFKRVNQIYQLLSDPLKRKQYDNLLEYEAFQKRRPPQQSAPKATTPKPRKTEAKKNTSNPYTTYKRNTTTQNKTKSLSDLKIN